MIQKRPCLYPPNVAVWSQISHPELFAIAAPASRPVEKGNPGSEADPTHVHPLVSLTFCPCPNDIIFTSHRPTLSDSGLLGLL